MAELFYHSGFCGPDKNQRKLKTTATMVRSCSLVHPNPNPEPNPDPNPDPDPDPDPNPNPNPDPNPNPKQVRSCSLALRDELLSLEAKGELGQVPRG